jgi:hypothetical protein
MWHHIPTTLIFKAPAITCSLAMQTRQQIPFLHQKTPGLLKLTFGKLKEKRGFTLPRYWCLHTSEQSHVLDGRFSITATVQPIKHFRVSWSRACVADRCSCCTLVGMYTGAITLSSRWAPYRTRFLLRI